MRIFWLAFLGLFLPIATVNAEPYRFCLAVSFAQKIVYITDIFADSQSQNTLEAQFSKQLSQVGRAHINVQCPYPTDRVAAFDAQHMARQFNQEMGYEIRNVTFKSMTTTLSQR